MDSHPKQQSRISQPGPHQGSYIDHSLSAAGGHSLAGGLPRGGLGLDREPEGDNGDIDAVRDVEDINVEVRDELAAVRLMERGKGSGADQKLGGVTAGGLGERSGNYEVDDIDYSRFLQMDAS